MLLNVCLELRNFSVNVPFVYRLLKLDIAITVAG